MYNDMVPTAGEEENVLAFSRRVLFTARELN